MRDGVDDVEQLAQPVGGRARPQFDRVFDASRLPGVRGQPANRPHAHAVELDAQPVGFRVSFRTHPAAARWSRCAPVNRVSTLTPAGAHRCGKCTTWSATDRYDPTLTTTANSSPILDPLQQHRRLVRLNTCNCRPVGGRASGRRMVRSLGSPWKYTHPAARKRRKWPRGYQRRQNPARLSPSTCRSGGC